MEPTASASLPSSQVWLSHLANSPRGQIPAADNFRPRALTPQLKLHRSRLVRAFNRSDIGYSDYSVSGVIGAAIQTTHQVNALLPQILQPQQECAGEAGTRCRDELSVLTDGVAVLNPAQSRVLRLLEQQAVRLQQHSLYDPLDKARLPNRDCFMFRDWAWRQPCSDCR